jgi:sugar phosphate isomerase/epimerase
VPLAEPITRRELVRRVSVAALGSAVSSTKAAAQATQAVPHALQVGLVSRHLQWTTLDDAVDIAARLGFDSIEWNVRTGGHVDPARVERELPRAVERTRRAGLSVPMITTSIQDAKSPHVDAILQTAAGLSIRYYRGGQYFRYDYTSDLWQQLQALKPRVASLAALNDRYGTVVAYHTHSGAGNIGGNIWDLWEVIREFNPRRVGLNYDIGHATVRAGSGWIDAAHVVVNHVAALAIKDAAWVRSASGGWRTEFCPLGEGMIDLKRMLDILIAARFQGPINIHFEHHDLLGTDVGTWKLSMTRQQFMETVGKDLRYVRDRLHDAGA